MTQPTNTVNLLIHDVNGQPQMLKVTPTKTTLGNILTPNLSGQTMKIFKATTQGGSQGTTVLTSGSQILRTISLQGPKPNQRPAQLVTIPIQSATGSPVKLTSIKTSEPTLLPKTIHIASNPMILNQAQRLAAQNVVSSNPQKNYISPILDHSGSRKKQGEIETDFIPEYSKRRKTEKVGKGLRHFSMKVCEKVSKKGTTSYNEVADELVAEFTNPVLQPNNDQYDQKNIRRRVYDALNVLMAMNIISKEKKEIRWLGLPTNSMQECIKLEMDKKMRLERIKQKKQQLQELILQQISFKNLVERNRTTENKNGPPMPNSAIQLPFIIINTNKHTVINCSISNDKREYVFNFDDTFGIHDDIEVLKRMNMCLGLDKGECTEEDIQRAKGMVPKSLENYVVELASGQFDTILDETDAGPSSSFNIDELECTMAVSELSRQSSHTSLSDPLSPSLNGYTDEESDLSSDEVEVN